MEKERSVAAGVILRGHEHEAWTLWRGLALGRAAKGVQNPDNCGISRKYAQAHGGDYGEAENEGHEKRIHVQPPLFKSA
jgi:hypothetical protein